MKTLLKNASLPIERKIKKVEEKHKVVFFILKDIFKFLKNKRII